MSEGIGTRDNGGEIDPADELVLSFTHMQVLEALQSTLTTYFPHHGGTGARTVVVEAFEQADQVFGAKGPQKSGQLILSCRRS